MASKAGSLKAALVLLSLIASAWAGRVAVDEPLPDGQEIGRAISEREPWIASLRRLFSAGGGGDYGYPYGSGSPSGYYGGRPSGPATARSEARSSGPGQSDVTYGGGYGEPPAPPAPVSGGSGGGCRKGDTSPQAIIDCTNAFRANPSMSRCGSGMRPVGPLRTDPALMSAAQGHSVAQDRARQMSHTLGGSTMSNRIKASGYRGRAYAENVAAGQRDAYAVVEAWMCSAGHRKNMMSCNYADLGVGVSCSTGRCYWTQNFGCSGSCNCNGGGASAPVGPAPISPSSGGGGGYPYPSRPSPSSGGGSGGGYPSYPSYPGRPSPSSGGGSGGGYPSYYPGSSPSSGGGSGGGYPSYYPGSSHSSEGGSGGGYPSYYPSRPSRPSHSSPSSEGSGYPSYYPGSSPNSAGSGGSGFPVPSGTPWGFPTDISGGAGSEIPGAGKGSDAYGYPSMPSMPTSTSPTSGGRPPMPSYPSYPSMPSMPSEGGEGPSGPSSARSTVMAGMGKVTTDAHARGYGQADGKGEATPDSASAYATARAMG